MYINIFPDFFYRSYIKLPKVFEDDHSAALQISDRNILIANALDVVSELVECEE